MRNRAGLDRMNSQILLFFHSQVPIILSFLLWSRKDFIRSRFSFSTEFKGYLFLCCSPPNTSWIISSLFYMQVLEEDPRCWSKTSKFVVKVSSFERMRKWKPHCKFHLIFRLHCLSSCRWDGHPFFSSLLRFISKNLFTIKNAKK